VNRGLPVGATQVHAVLVDGLWICTVMTGSRWQFAGHGLTPDIAFHDACNRPARDMATWLSSVPEPDPEPTTAA
jgi:hypothetical protein